MINKSVTIMKGWGNEVIWASNNLYCGKFLNFDTNGISSMHFHAVKTETWYVLTGRFELTMIDTKTAESYIEYLVAGDIIDIPPLSPHQLVCIEKGSIMEVSSADSKDDNYRLTPGDSQK